jgi:hypothetical protein
MHDQHAYRMRQRLQNVRSDLRLFIFHAPYYMRISA